MVWVRIDEALKLGAHRRFIDLPRSWVEFGDRCFRARGNAFFLVVWAYVFGTFCINLNKLICAVLFQLQHFLFMKSHFYNRINKISLKDPALANVYNVFTRLLKILTILFLLLHSLFHQDFSCYRVPRGEEIIHNNIWLFTFLSPSFFTLSEMWT